MSKYTPGPFYVAGGDFFSVRSGAAGHAFVAAGTRDMPGIEVANLLNKGTHFDRMLEALEEAEQWLSPEPRAVVMAVIAKAKGLA